MSTLKSNKSLIFYTQQGTAHKKLDMPCQDVVGFSKRKDIIVLADGAGSEPHSLEGAEFSVNTWIDLLKDHKDKPFRKVSMELVDIYQKKLIEYAKIKEIPFSSLASTLLVLKINKKENTYSALSIGDSLIGYGIKKDDQYDARPIFIPQNGELANETWMTTSNDLKSHTQVIESDIPNLCIGFFMMSDGPAKVLFQKNEKKMAPAVGKLFHVADALPQKNAQERLEKFMKDIISAYSSDDLSYIQIML